MMAGRPKKRIEPLKAGGRAKRGKWGLGETALWPGRRGFPVERPCGCKGECAPTQGQRHALTGRTARRADKKMEARWRRRLTTP